MNKIKMICKYCGSTNVSCDGILAWDIQNQRWTIKTELQNEDCEDCGANGSVIKEEVLT